MLLKTGRIISPKHVELTGIINKLLLLHLVGCLYYLYQRCTVKQISDIEIYLLIKYIKSVLWRAAKRLPYTEDARCLKCSNWADRATPVVSILRLSVVLCCGTYSGIWMGETTLLRPTLSIINIDILLIEIQNIMHSWMEPASCSFELLFPMLIDLSIQPTKRSAQLDIQRYFSSVDGTLVLTSADQLKSNLKALCD